MNTATLCAILAQASDKTMIATDMIQQSYEAAKLLQRNEAAGSLIVAKAELTKALALVDAILTVHNATR
jgi:hypothetical protein